MKTALNYFWLLLLVLLGLHGAMNIRNEWQRKAIHDHGALIEVKIEELNCPQQMMSFKYSDQRFQKSIDARTCALFNEGQKIKLKHSPQYPDTFLFVNERSPNRFILGGLEIALGIIGLMTNWPSINRRRSTHPKSQTSRLTVGVIL
jgi:hypothetical protein